jgi:hypothetical protein
MADSAAGPLTPSAEAATIVFVRPSLYAGVFNPSIFIDGRYVGDVEGGTQVAIQVPPGEHVIFAGIHDFMVKACRQMVAKVDAGKIYFVETTVANGSDLFAVRAADSDKLRVWLQRAPTSRKLDPAKQSENPMDAKEKAECAVKAVEHFKDDDPQDKAKHTVTPADGFASVP